MISKDSKEFGNFLKELRNKKGLTLTELAEKLGMSQPYLSQIENGKKGIPSPGVLGKLADPLGVTYIELMTKAGYMTKELLSIHVDFDESYTEEEREILRKIIGDIEEKDLYYLTNVNKFSIDYEGPYYEGPLYYKGKLLTDEQREKIHLMLKALLE